MIRVDALMPWGWTYGPSCHLFCEPEDNLEELHRFAARIGMKRAWFQVSNGGMPHYDLTRLKRKLAVNAGAVETDRMTTCSVIRSWSGRSVVIASPAAITTGEGQDGAPVGRNLFGSENDAGSAKGRCSNMWGRSNLD